MKTTPAFQSAGRSAGTASSAGENSRQQITTAEYDYLCELVYAQSRITLGSAKKELVSSRIAKRLRGLGLSSIREYCNYLKSSQGEAELTDLVDVISTNVTDFFRERAHFDFLQSRVLPRFADQKSEAHRTFRIWSAACSSGEEPYSLAIVLAEFFRAHPNAWQVEASDISTKILEQARAGIYKSERVKVPNPEWLGRYFQRGVGSFDGHCRVKEGLRKRVSFHHINLFQPRYPIAPELDVIFCRNVMIYFDRPTQQELVERLHDHLRPGGFLVVGHSESLIGIQHALEPIQPSIYRRNHAPNGLADRDSARRRGAGRGVLALHENPP